MLALASCVSLVLFQLRMHKKLLSSRSQIFRREQRVSWGVGGCSTAAFAALSLGFTFGALARESDIKAIGKNSPVVPQLGGTQGFRFSGFYMAQAKGFYRQVGLDLETRKRLAEGDSAAEVRKLVNPDVVAMGHMSPRRWREARYGPFAAGKDVDELTHKVATEFMFDETLTCPSMRRVRVLLRALVVVGGAICLLLVVVYLFEVLVVRRTKALADANRALQEDRLKCLETEKLLQKYQELAVALSECVSISDCLRKILETMMQLPGVDCCGIYLKRQASDVLELALHQGFGEEFASQYARIRNDGICGAYALAEGPQCYDCEMLQKMNDPVIQREDLRASMTFPVMHQSQLVASMHMASHSVTSFQEGTISFGETVAMKVGGAIARHFAIAALHESEENFRRVAECAFDGLVVLGMDGWPVYANPEALKFMGCTLERFSERSFTDSVVPAFVERVKERLRCRLDGRFVPDHYELVLRRADGADVPFDATVRRMDWKGQPAILYTFRDISERKRLETEVLSVVEWEKRRIAHNLHDSLGQQLVGISFMLDALTQKLSESCQPFAMEAARIQNLCMAARREVRHIVWGVLPFKKGASLQQCLSRLVVEIADRLGVECVFNGDGGGLALTPVAIEHLCHIVQESVTNAVKHGCAKRVDIALHHEQDGWALVVEDDGCGFDHADIGEGGAGIRIMGYRADIIGGTLNLSRRDERGMQMVCRFSHDATFSMPPEDVQGEQV